MGPGQRRPLRAAGPALRIQFPLIPSGRQTYPSGYGARLLSECALHAQVRTLPSAMLFPGLRAGPAKERWICASAAPPLPKITLWRPGRAQLLPTFQAKCNARTVGMSAPFLIRPDTNQVCKRGRNAKHSQPAVPYQCRPTMQFCRSSHCPLSGTGSSRVRGGWAPL